MLSNLKINHLQHIGIPVTNLKASEAFYAQLGFRNVMSSTFEISGEKGGMVSMLQNGTVLLELYQMPPTHLAGIGQRTDGHVDHFAFDVDDIDATFQMLKNAGFTVVEDQPVFLNFWTKGCKYFNILGPDGERVEFNQILS
jgi:lactoylglutathione lyase